MNRASAPDDGRSAAPRGAAGPSDGRRRRAGGGRPPPPPAFVTGYAPLLAALALLRRAARGDAPVLVIGEAGTGKALLARHVHAASARAAGPFVATVGTRLGGPDDDAASFGVARGGTLYVAGIAGLSPRQQVRVARALDRRSADVRLVASAPPGTRVAAAGGALHPLLARSLRTVRVQLPPLADRAGDVGLLAECFAARATAGRRRLPPHVVGLLERRPWPGNVRELRTVVARMVSDPLVWSAARSDRPRRSRSRSPRLAAGPLARS